MSSSTRFCEACGAQNPTNSLFCSTCGTKIAPVDAGAIKTTESVKPVDSVKPIDQQPQQQPPNQYQYQPQQQGIPTTADQTVFTEDFQGNQIEAMKEFLVLSDKSDRLFFSMNTPSILVLVALFLFTSSLFTFLQLNATQSFIVLDGELIDITDITIAVGIIGVIIVNLLWLLFSAAILGLILKGSFPQNSIGKIKPIRTMLKVNAYRSMILSFSYIVSSILSFNLPKRLSISDGEGETAITNDWPASYYASIEIISYIGQVLALLYLYLVCTKTLKMQGSGPFIAVAISALPIILSVAF
jgi:hypothetical protein